MRVFVVLSKYTDGSPSTDTDISGVYLTKNEAEVAIEGNPREDPGIYGGSWYEIEEWPVGGYHGEETG